MISSTQYHLSADTLLDSSEATVYTDVYCLKMDNTRIQQKDVDRYITMFPSITTLQMKNCRVEVSLWKVFPLLQILEIESCDGILATDVLLQDKLKFLNMSHSLLDFRGFKPEEAVPTTQLRKVKWSGNEKILPIVFEIYKNVEHFDIHCFNTTEHVVYLDTFKNLVRLTVCNTEDIVFLGRNLGTLRKLTLVNTVPYNLRCILDIARLQELSLQSVNNGEIIDICTGNSHTSLKKMVLVDCCLMGGVYDILSQYPELVSLNVEGCHFTQARLDLDRQYTKLRLVKITQSNNTAFGFIPSTLKRLSLDTSPKLRTLQRLLEANEIQHLSIRVSGKDQNEHAIASAILANNSLKSICIFNAKHGAWWVPITTKRLLAIGFPDNYFTSCKLITMLKNVIRVDYANSLSLSTKADTRIPNIVPILRTNRTLTYLNIRRWVFNRSGLAAMVRFARKQNNIEQLRVGSTALKKSLLQYSAIRTKTIEEIATLKRKVIADTMALVSRKQGYVFSCLANIVVTFIC